VGERHALGRDRHRLSISSAKQAGIEWFSASPSTATGSLTATLANQGYAGLGNDNLTYPAIGITSSGTGVMAFTAPGARLGVAPSVAAQATCCLPDRRPQAKAWIRHTTLT
jgi:hypothetical protein